jgi:hypothetical protein
MRPRPMKTMRLMILVGLVCLEISLIIGFYILPQFQARNAPLGHWEMETPLRDSPGGWAVLIAFLGLLTFGNIGLMVMIWPAFKELKINK